MLRSILIATCLPALFAGSAIAQGFPAMPVTLICPYQPGSSSDHYLRTFARIAAKYLGQPVNVENKPGEANTLGPVTMSRAARPDGYTLSLLPETVFRMPHLKKVDWDPIRDFTYIIGIGAHTVGVVVKHGSQFQSIRDVIEFAKANPGKLLYGGTGHGNAGHLAMEELGIKAGVRFRRAEPSGFVGAADALMSGKLHAIASVTSWGPLVDAGTLRLLLTFGEKRSRWNAPTAAELGFDIVSYTPFGIAGPKGMDAKVAAVLHDAFFKVLDDPELDPLLRQLDIVDWYKSSEDYAEWAIDQFKFQRALVERTIGLGKN